MANNNRDNTKGSFWKKLFNNAAAREGINDHEEERQQVNPAPSNYSSSANDMLTANSSSTMNIMNYKRRIAVLLSMNKVQ